MSDITQLIFKSSVWLLTGLVLYYVLSTIKVFLLVKVQSQLFHSEVPELSIEKLFPKYIKEFIGNVMLHQCTINYLINKGGKSTWKLVGNKKINFYYNFLNTITVMLKPFLIIAILWAILKFLILKHIAFDELQISLGQIQIVISYLKSLKGLEFFDHYKVFLFILIVIFCGIFGVVKKNEAKINRSKSIIYTCFTILSILSGLSFFGSDLSKTKNDNLQKLGDLDLKVREIHENIYRDVAKAVVYEDLSQAIKEDIKNNEKESQRLDSLYNKAFEIITRQEIKNKLSEKFNTQKEEYDKLISLEVNKKDDVKNNMENKFVFSHFIKEHFNNSQSNKNSTVQDYWTNQNNWNKATGLSFTKSIEELKSHKYFTGKTESEVRIIVENVVENLVDYFVEEIFNKTAKYFGVEKLELPKSIASFLAIEKCKECFVPKIIDVVKVFGNKTKMFNKLKTFYCFNKQGKSLERINAVKEEHNATYNDNLAQAEKEQMIAIANEKAENLIREKITKIVKGYDPENSARYEGFIDEVIKKYKVQIDIENMSEESFNKLITTNQISDAVLKDILSNVKIKFHPFPPPPECPICAFQFGFKLLK